MMMVKIKFFARFRIFFQKFDSEFSFPNFFFNFSVFSLPSRRFESMLTLVSFNSFLIFLRKISKTHSPLKTRVFITITRANFVNFSLETQELLIFHHFPYTLCHGQWSHIAWWRFMWFLLIIFLLLPAIKYRTRVGIFNTRGVLSSWMNWNLWTE